MEKVDIKKVKEIGLSAVVKIMSGSQEATTILMEMISKKYRKGFFRRKPIIPEEKVLRVVTAFFVWFVTEAFINNLIKKDDTHGRSVACFIEIQFVKLLKWHKEERVMPDGNIHLFVPEIDCWQNIDAENFGCFFEEKVFGGIGLPKNRASSEISRSILALMSLMAGFVSKELNDLTDQQVSDLNERFLQQSKMEV